MKKPFDPFDEKHRYKRRKRRTREQIEYEAMLEHRKLVEPVRLALNYYPGALALVGHEVLQTTMQFTKMYSWTRQNLSKIMLELGYAKYNSGRKDGRWKIGGRLVTVFQKIDAKEKDFLREVFEEYGVKLKR